MKLPELRPWRLPERIGWRDHVVGAAMALVYVGWLLTGARSLGFPRDEGTYFRAGADYFRWYRLVFERGREALSQSAIDGAWSLNHEHPALMKTLFGASEWLLHERFHVFADASTAFRLPAMGMAGIALWVTYLFGARAFSRPAGAMAAALLALTPRVFFHAHFACFDVPIVTMWIGCIYAHWRALERRTLLWALAAGVAFGLTLETKHNAWLLPFVLVPHALAVQGREMLSALRAGRFSVPLGLASMATVGPLVFLALWPYLWNDTVARIEWWVEFHTHHDYYNIEYLHRNYFGPPSPPSYVPFMVLATVPTVTLALFAIGAGERLKLGARRAWRWVLQARAKEAGESEAGESEAVEPDPLHTDLLLALSILGAIFMFFRPTTPIFGGTKHWLTAYPALALFAGRGFEIVRAAMRRALTWDEADPRRRGAEVALVACVLAAPLAVTAHTGDFGLATYVPLVGGTKGGADLGLNRQFWGYTTEDAATEYLNPQAPRGASVFIHDTTWDAWGRMQEEGRVRGDLRGAGSPGEANFALVQHELHMNEVDYSIWVAMGTDAPAYVVTHDGVPIVSVYRRP